MYKGILPYKKSGIIVLLFNVCLAAYPQQANQFENVLKQVYELSLQKYGMDQQLANGVYFEDIYRTSNGHPYFVEDAFSSGSIVYLNKQFDHVEIKYDIFDQRLVIKNSHPKFPLLTILTDPFLTSFSIHGADFKKLNSEGDVPEFYQVVEERSEIQCYYYWYKNRKESINYNDVMIYSFTPSKRRCYIQLEGQLLKYRRNKSFVNLFPEDLRVEVYKLLRTSRIKVNKASLNEMQSLVGDCQDLLIKYKD